MPIFIFSHYKSMATISCHRQPELLSDWGKNNIIHSYMQNMVRIGFREEVVENVDDGWTEDGYLSQVSSKLKQVAQRATNAHLSPMCQGQISFQKTYQWAMETRGPKSSFYACPCYQQL